MSLLSMAYMFFWTRYFGGAHDKWDTNEVRQKADNLRRENRWRSSKEILQKGKMDKHRKRWSGEKSEKRARKRWEGGRG